MQHIEQSYSIKAPVDAVWQALVDPDVIEQWGGGPALMSDAEGAEFSLWGGDIYGINIKVIECQLLVQEWYGSKDWSEPSRLTLTLSAQGGITVVNLVQENIPEDELEDIAQGWKDYYLGPLQELLEG